MQDDVSICGWWDSRRSAAGAGFVALALGALLTACGRTPAQPTNTPLPAVPLTIQLSGPATANLGETTQYTAVMLWSDGSRQDITNTAQWTSSSEDLAFFEEPGLVRGRNRGRASIGVAFEGRSASREVTVLPAGTFTLYGDVLERDFPPIPLAGAVLEVVGGTGTGLTTVTDDWGRYEIFGVSGAVEVRATKAGYVPAIAQITVTGAQEFRFGFVLDLATTRPDVSGRHTLTLSASAGCGVGIGAGNLPPEAARRVYGATVAQDGPLLRISLDGAEFPRNLSRFEGWIQPEGLRFHLPWDDFTGVPAILERLPSGRFLGVGGGTMSAALSGRRIVGSLSGALAVFDEFSRGDEIAVAWCDALDHEVVLSR